MLRTPAEFIVFVAFAKNRLGSYWNYVRYLQVKTALLSAKSQVISSRLIAELSASDTHIHTLNIYDAVHMMFSAVAICIQVHRARFAYEMNRTSSGV